MRIVTETAVRKWSREKPDAASSLLGWLAAAKAARWENLDQVRLTYPHADPARVASGHTVTIFNVAGNKYRLITAIHYNKAVIFTLLFLTHAEYSKNRWKDKL